MIGHSASRDDSAPIIGPQSRSPTARALLRQIQLEEQAAADQRAAERAEAAEVEAATRRQQITNAKDATTSLLTEYDTLAKRITAILLEVAALQRTLPGGVTSLFPVHLRRVHVPPSELAPLDPIFPVFLSVEAALQGKGL
jgi:hypothetical protein